MILDLEKTDYKGPEPTIVQQDARTFCPEENSIEAIITSPPYLNKIEYTSVYKMELGLFFNEQETRLRAYVSDAPDVVPRDGLPTIAVAYFDDMRKVMQNMFTALKSKGKAFIIVAGGCLPDRAIESDDILIKRGAAYTDYDHH
jgi:DNA modification methylase